MKDIKQLGMWRVPAHVSPAGEKIHQSYEAGWEDEAPHLQATFTPADPERLFSVTWGDGCHWGIDEPYPQLEALLRLALGTGQSFSTGWYSSKKEILSGRVTRAGNVITCEASVSDDFDTEGRGSVKLSLTGDEPVEKVYEEVMQALQSAWSAADLDRQENEVYAGFSLHPLDQEGKPGPWVDTLLLPKDDGYEDGPPGDYYDKWGWQNEDEGECPEETKKLLERWAWSYLYGEPVGVMRDFDGWRLRAWEEG